MDDQEDIDSAAEHQMTVEEARRYREHEPDIAFWAKVYDEAVARHRAEQAQLKALTYALDRIFEHIS